MKRFEKSIFIVDGIIAILFGIISFFSPKETFATLFTLPASEQDLVYSLLATISSFYCVIGLSLIVSAFVSEKHRMYFAYVMVVRHIWAIALVFTIIEKPWLIGNPYYDVVIHSVFILLYLFLVLRKGHLKNQQ